MKKNLPNSLFGNSQYLKEKLCFFLIIIFLVGFSCTSFAQTVKSKKSKHLKQAATSNNQRLTYQLIASAGNTYGYDILQNSHKLIHQPSKPGLPGNRGFTRKVDAVKVAKLVISKIKNNQMPPTVSKQEMDSLKVKL